MKWLKNRAQFINEAKIKDVILPSQINAIKDLWGEKYLEYEEVTPTNKIQQGKWKLSEDDKYAVLGEFTNSDVKNIFEIFRGLPDAFAEFISLSIIEDKIKDMNIQTPSLYELGTMYDNVFKKISIPDTFATSVVSKDSSGVPLRDESGNMIRVEKTPGDFVFSNNKININSVVVDYNSMIDKYTSMNIGDKYSDSDKIDNRTFNDDDIQNFISMVKSPSEYYEVDYDAFNKDIYLSINHNPKDILNMSISRFYTSCQNLYTGMYNERVLGNVFDPNSIPAFLIFDSPIFLDDVKISDKLPLSRMIIRNIETIDNYGEGEPKLYFDRAYPDRMRSIFSEIIEKYTDNRTIDAYEGETYLYSPDIDIEDNISEPYHDNFEEIKNIKYIGKNAKSLTINRWFKWDDYKIAPGSKIKEMTIETIEVPENLFDITLDLDLLRFRYLYIKSLTPFERIKTSGVSFENSKLSKDVFDQIDKDVKFIRMVSLDNNGLPNLNQFDKLEEVHLIYTLDSFEELKTVINDIRLKKLVISGDLVTRESKQYLTALRSKGTKIEVVGPSNKNI